MTNGAHFRNRARAYEQRENWKRAIEEYELAIQADRKARREPDLALYNRIGDLYRRVGDVARAVHYYELAVDGHLSAGFYNNAIALCNKILRNQPNRHSAYLKLGKIGAAKGFLSDARRHFLEYADRMRRSDRLGEAFSALIEFADLSPDPEVRLMIADQLLDHGREPQAVEQMRLAWRDLRQEGREADAAEVRNRILALAPQRDPEVDPPAEDTSSPGVDAVGILELPELLPYGEEEPPVDQVRKPSPKQVDAARKPPPKPEVEAGGATGSEGDAGGERPDRDHAIDESFGTPPERPFEHGTHDWDAEAEEDQWDEAAAALEEFLDLEADRGVQIDVDNLGLDTGVEQFGEWDEGEREAPADSESLEIVPTSLVEEDAAEEVVPDPSAESLEIEQTVLSGEDEGSAVVVDILEGDLVPTSAGEEDDSGVAGPEDTELETAGPDLEDFIFEPTDVGEFETELEPSADLTADRAQDTDVEEVERVFVDEHDGRDDLAVETPADEAELPGLAMEAPSEQAEEAYASRGEILETPEEVGGAVVPGDVMAEPAGRPEARISSLQARILREGRRPGLLVELAEARLELGDTEAATTDLREALEGFEERGEYGQARGVLDELLRLDVNDVASYQKGVELALKAHDPRGLIEAYLSLADCLDRIDLTDKARIVYARVLELDPGNRQAGAGLEMIGAPATAPARGRSARREGRGKGGGDFVDLAALVREEEEIQAKSTRFRIPTPDPQSEDEVNFSDMLRQFKSMVSDAIEEEDSASHYDLGVAYKEMGLIDEAIAEFQIAARDPACRLRAIEMLGVCFSEKGDQRIALKVLRRALQLRGCLEEDLVGIFYAMARAHEELDDREDALECYERVLGSRMDFRDAAVRARALRS